MPANSVGASSPSDADFVDLIKRAFDAADRGNRAELRSNMIKFGENLNLRFSQLATVQRIGNPGSSGDPTNPNSGPGSSLDENLRRRLNKSGFFEQYPVSAASGESLSLGMAVYTQNGKGWLARADRNDRPYKGTVVDIQVEGGTTLFYVQPGGTVLQRIRPLVEGNANRLFLSIYPGHLTNERMEEGKIIQQELGSFTRYWTNDSNQVVASMAYCELLASPVDSMEG